MSRTSLRAALVLTAITLTGAYAMTLLLRALVDSAPFLDALTTVMKRMRTATESIDGPLKARSATPSPEGAAP